MNLGTPALAQPTSWLRRETVESIAHEGTQCIVRSGDGELVRLAQPQSGLASRVRSVLAGFHLADRSVALRPTPAEESEVMAALKEHYRNFEGPEKPFLPRALINSSPRAAAREVLENFQAARRRLLETGAPLASQQAIEQAVRQAIPSGAPDREEHIRRITQQAVQFASLRWKDDYIFDRMPADRIRALVMDLTRSIDPPAEPAG